ncbi:MAG: type II secretion system minor pseudopilin GspK [Dokdonella sp.]|uniref:type II secretion system minor pseudopilin GspK n=1 Tax=Dokdonella sp. TaxID=2291710 RepID=UPI003267F7BF
MRTSAKHQQGVALLVALLVVALAVILVAALLDRGELALARTRNALRSEQAEAYAQGLEIYAVQVLVDTQREGGTDTNASPWATPLPPQPVPGGVIAATMHDMNGCFNLNNLSGSNGTIWEQRFKVLLTTLAVNPSLADAVSHWLDGNGTSDDSYYLAQPVPYRASRRNFSQVSELRLVKGVDGETYARLAPHVCALPAGTSINVNTATVPVLQSLGISQSNAEKIWNNGQANYPDLPKFATAAQLPPESPLTGLGVKSTYFLARGDIVLDDVPFTFFSLIERVQGRTSMVISRSRGSDDALIAPAAISADPARDTTLR